MIIRLPVEYQKGIEEMTDEEFELFMRDNPNEPYKDPLEGCTVFYCESSEWK